MSWEPAKSVAKLHRAGPNHQPYQHKNTPVLQGMTNIHEYLILCPIPWGRYQIMSAIYDFASQLWAAMRADFEAELDRRFTAADNACHGHLVNREGKAAGITGRSLFTGPVDRAYKYASRELVDHWTAHGRITMQHFEKEWVDARGGIEAYA